MKFKDYINESVNVNPEIHNYLTLKAGFKFSHQDEAGGDIYKRPNEIITIQAPGKTKPHNVMGGAIRIPVWEHTDFKSNKAGRTGNDLASLKAHLEKSK